MASASPLYQPAADPLGLSAPCNIFYVQRRGGWHQLTGPRLVKHVAQLVAAHDFPTPYPSRRGGAVTTDVVVASTWPRVAVDAWFDNFLPPAGAQAADAATRAAAAADMDASARNLKLVATRFGGRAA